MDDFPDKYKSPANASFEPARYPLGEYEHHSNVPYTADDEMIAIKLGWYMGDLFLTPGSSPRKQWRAIARALRVHGLQIVNKP